VMSNYRVGQVLTLGPMPERQLRFLCALAMFMDDDSRSVRVGFDALVTVSGQSRNTVRKARRELEASGRVTALSGGRGPGDLTTWAVGCLPDKGVSVLDPLTGPDESPLRGSTGAEERVTYLAPDLGERVTGLNRRAKSPTGDGRSVVQPPAEPEAQPEDLGSCPDCGGDLVLKRSAGHIAGEEPPLVPYCVKCKHVWPRPGDPVITFGPDPDDPWDAFRPTWPHWPEPDRRRSRSYEDYDEAEGF
jgi:hypothetical protein